MLRAWHRMQCLTQPEVVVLLEEIFARLARARRSTPTAADDKNLAVKPFYEVWELAQQEESMPGPESGEPE